MEVILIIAEDTNQIIEQREMKIYGVQVRISLRKDNSNSHILYSKL